MVESARLELETYIAEVRVTDVGRDAWIRGKQARAEGLKLAREALSRVPSPRQVGRRKARRELGLLTADDVVGLDARERNRRFVDRVVVKAVGRGRRVHPAERCSVSPPAGIVQPTAREPRQRGTERNSPFPPKRTSGMGYCPSAQSRTATGLEQPRTANSPFSRPLR